MFDIVIAIFVYNYITEIMCRSLYLEEKEKKKKNTHQYSGFSAKPLYPGKEQSVTFSLLSLSLKLVL